MDSDRLSARAKQPGHDRTFLTSETNFARALRRILPQDQYAVHDKPADLRGLFKAGAQGRNLGLVPEVSLVSRKTGRRMYFEVKKQGAGGNAEERACKHHTVQFYRTMAAFTGYDYHPFCTVFCEQLATNPRYTTKFPFLFEEGHYFLWVDYGLELLARFIRDTICARFLDPQEVR